MAVFFFGFPSIAEADASTVRDPFDQIMKLRLEVEERNTLWEQEKKRLQSEYEVLVNRTGEIQADVLRKRAQLEVLRARISSVLKRSERRQIVSGLDRRVLTEMTSEYKALSDRLLPFGRSEIRAKLHRISGDLAQGRGSVDEVAVDFAQILKSELKLSRGMHLVKEEIQVENELVAVEAALIGGYTAFFAAADGRAGKWNVREQRSQWIVDEKEQVRTLDHLETVRKFANSSRPVILDFQMEEK